mgnify:CR=1 FL=1
MSNTESQKYICQFCDSELKSELVLIHHQKHTKYCLKLQGLDSTTKHICEYCNKSYSSLSNLNYHRKTAKFCIEKRNSEKNKDEISNNEVDNDTISNKQVNNSENVDKEEINTFNFFSYSYKDKEKKFINTIKADDFSKSFSLLERI